jgi:hypothetical protein
LLDREINRILLHVAQEIPMAPGTVGIHNEPKVPNRRLSTERRAAARAMVNLYLLRVEKLARERNEKKLPEMVTYAQILERALGNEKTLQ